MKHLLILFLFATLSVSAQQTTIRRITDRTETIPSSDTLTGIVKIDSNYSSTYKFLQYIGTTNIANTFPSGATGVNGWMWIYVPAATANYFAKVLSVSAVGDATLDTFRIQVDRVMVFTASQPFLSMTNKLYGYSFQNDGGATGTANGVNIINLEAVTMSRQDIEGTSNNPYQDPVKIAATTTSFLIIERKGK